MGQILYGCATTTEAVRRAIHHRQASLGALAKRYGIIRVEDGRGCLGRSATLRFPSPPIKLDVRTRIQLSDRRLVYPRVRAPIEQRIGFARAATSR
jgi:hypothetical protein